MEGQVYGEIPNGEVILNTLLEYWDQAVGSADNQFALLRAGNFSNLYDHRGMRVELQLQHCPDGKFRVGFAAGRWNDEQDAVFLGDWEGRLVPNEGGSEIPEVYAGPTLPKGTPNPIGDGTVSDGEGGFIKPTWILRGGL